MFQQDQHKGLLRGLFWAIPFWALVMAANLDLTDSEAYLWTLAKNLDWKHYAQPPFPTWLTAFFTGLFGDASWAIRLPTLLARSAALGLFVIWSSDRWSRSVAKRALWILLGSFASIAGAVIAVADSYFCFFAIWAILCADRRKHVGTGIALGCAMLTKGYALSLVPGIIWAFGTRRRNGPRWISLLGVFFIATLMQILALQSRAFQFTPYETIHANSFFSACVLVFSSPLLLGALSLIGAGLVAAWIIKRRGLSAPILGYNRSDSVRVPLVWWILPNVLWLIYSATQGSFRSYHTAFLLFPLCAGLASILNFSSPDQEARFEWKMLLLGLGTMTLVSITLLYPVGVWIKPLTERFRIYDLRQSPRGDLMGWKTWAKEDLMPAGLVNDQVAFIASDYHLASQAAWAMNLRLPQYGTIGPLHQYRYWPSPLHASYAKYVFYADNRHLGLQSLEALCAEPIHWNVRDILLKGDLVKRIYWSVCTKLK